MVDFAVVGGGIAGLAIAELLQRSGAGTLLVEKNGYLCGEAAAEQHGWFHTGALYAALPRGAFLAAMQRNVEHLLRYYACFPGMNFQAGGDEPAGHDAAGSPWFSSRRISFVYSDLRHVGWPGKLPWSFAVTRAAGRASRSRVPAGPGGAHLRLTTRRELQGFAATHGLDLHEARLLSGSQDRVMDATAIAADLATSFVTHGGEISLRTTAVRSGGSWTATGPAGAGTALRHARHVVVSTGRWAPQFGHPLHVHASPILVAAPALTHASLAFMSPQVSRTISHLFHRTGTLEYSVLGNASYYDPARLDALRGEVRTQMIDRTRQLLPHLSARHRVGLYFGYKTERPVGPGPRNYLSYVRSEGAETLALPGKFTLCFGLAVEVCRHLGITPAEHGLPLAAGGRPPFLAETRHLRLARQLTASDRATAPDDAPPP